VGSNPDGLNILGFTRVSRRDYRLDYRMERIRDEERLEDEKEWKDSISEGIRL
jgi:hypothetical protein